MQLAAANEQSLPSPVTGIIISSICIRLNDLRSSLPLSLRRRLFIFK
jgi:hypothetical protein